MFNQDSLLSYLPENTLLIIDEPLSVQRTIEDFDNKAMELRQDQQAQGELPANFPKPYFNWDEMAPALEKIPRLILSELGIADKESMHHLDFKSLPSYGGQLPVFISKIKQLLADKQRVVLVTHQANRLSELLGENDIIAPVLTEIRQTLQPGSLTLLQGLTQCRLESTRYSPFYRCRNLRLYQAAAPAKETTGRPSQNFRRYSTG